jgi:hypothetical protein
MKVVKIDWMDEEAREAIMTISSGSFMLQVFSHPCPYNVGDTIKVPLTSLDDENIVRIEPIPAMIKQVGDTFRHEVIAVVVNAKTSLVAIGDIKIELGGYLPGDIVDGDCISFQTSRLDA